MALELRKVSVKDMRFGDVSRIDDGVLSIDARELEALILQDERIASAAFHIARPGESVRIMPVKDVIQPMAKADGRGFSGFIGEVYEAGQGVTYVLSNTAVVTTGPIVGFQEGVIDMTGPLTDYCLFSKLNNVVLEIQKRDGVEPHEHEEAVRRAGLKAAHYLGTLAASCERYEAETFCWNDADENRRDEGLQGLPRVVYVYLCMSQGLLHDTYFYGRDTKLITPTLLSPLEVLDGALVSGNCVSPGSKTTTYHHQNNAIIMECFKRHGKEINFAGVVLNPLMTTLMDKKRNTVLTGKLTRLIGADGVVVSMEGFGNPTSDLFMICKNLENSGVKTVLLTNEDAGADGMSESLPDGAPEGIAIVSTGNPNATIELPKMERVIGHISDIERLTGGCAGCMNEAGELRLEIHGIMGSHNLQGSTYLSAITV